jgi:hypothetical protein
MEESLGCVDPSMTICNEYDCLHDQLTTWSLPDEDLESFEDLELRHHAAEALRHAIHIFLATALAGAVVSSPGIRATMAHHVHAVFAETPHLVRARKYVATILWPILVAGSCLSKPEWQEVMVREMRSSWAQIRQLEVWSKLLELLYKDPDPRAFGPYGLYLTMEKHGMNVANA